MKRFAGRPQLDATIVEIELTLVSIIQGVALTVLIETAREIMTEHPLISGIYIVAGLLIILIFWSRAILHIITVIRWPLEFGHNFLYIACALIESLLFAQAAKPANWFQYAAGFIAIGWILFVYDLRLINARILDSAGEANNVMCDKVKRDQLLNIAVLLPGVFVLNVACAISIRAWPQFFLAQHGHLWLVAIQLVAFVGYLCYVVKFYSKLAPFIARAHAEWQVKSDTSDSADPA